MSNNTLLPAPKGSYKRAFAEVAARFPVRKNPVLSASLGGASLMAIGLSQQFLGTAVTVEQAIGFAGLFFAYQSTKAERHSDLLAVASVSCGLTAAQQVLQAYSTQDYGGAIMLGQAALVTSVFSKMTQPYTITEDLPQTTKEKLKALNKKINKPRRIFALASGTLGAIAAVCVSEAFGKAAGYIPAITTFLNPIVSGIPDAFSHVARLSYVAFNAAHGGYFLTQPEWVEKGLAAAKDVSWGLVGIEAMFIYGHLKTIFANDVPRINTQTGEPLTCVEMVKGYFTGLNVPKIKPQAPSEAPEPSI